MPTPTCGPISPVSHRPQGPVGAPGLSVLHVAPSPEARTHHFFQLILNLPVHLSHLEEDVSWNGEER